MLKVTESFCCFPHMSTHLQLHPEGSITGEAHGPQHRIWLSKSPSFKVIYIAAWLQHCLFQCDSAGFIHACEDALKNLCVGSTEYFFSFSFSVWFTVIYDLKWSSCLFIKAMNRTWDPVLKGYRKLLFLLLSEDIDNLRMVTDSKSWQTIKPFPLMPQDQTYFNIVVSQPLSFPSWCDIMVFPDLTFWTER